VVRTRPTIFTPRFSNSSFSFAKAPSSVVQTGVKSAGCENRIAQLLSMKLWKSMSPCVVVAWKLGAGVQSAPAMSAIWIGRCRTN
jgi:hypothetical protein